MANVQAKAEPQVAVTRPIAEEAAARRFEDLPLDVIEIVRQCLMDWIAVAVGGSDDPSARLLLEAAVDEGGPGRATLIAAGRRGTAAQAALVNGNASHVLDYDDVNMHMSVHPSAVIFPALLALAEERGASGRDVINAFVTGYEGGCRIGLLMSPGHYRHGFHGTATIGTFAAAIACARLLDLDASKTAHAIGIAATEAAGIRAMFGTMCKALHAGKTAQNGLFAAVMAARGFQSREDALECEHGFAATHGPDFHPDRALAKVPGDGYRLHDNLFKFHAACYAVHAPIEALIELKTANGITPDMVEGVTMRVAPHLSSVCDIREPKTGLEAKFSLRFSAALVLGGQDTGRPEAFADELTGEPGLVALRDKIDVAFDPAFSQYATQVDIRLRNGTTVTTRQAVGKPMTDLSAQRARLRAKFDKLVIPSFGGAAAGEIVAHVEDLARASSIAPLMKLCAGPAK